jgi:glycosyltransferase involved in cell wall biosynthesis
MSIKLPVITCVCVTRNKPLMLKRAIACFTAQSYPAKELVIVYEDDDSSTEKLVNEAEIISRDDIQLVRIKSVPKTTLGELRNIGINAARGGFICQWDDDDWCHKNRLTEQYNVIMKHDREGAVMTQWLVFDAIDKVAYISNKRVWEGSVLCKKTALQLMPYENKSIGEDSATIDYLVSQNCLHLMNDVPGLYIYVYHGSNTWNFEHWNYIFECSTALSYDHSLCIADILNGKYSVYAGSLLLDKMLQNEYVDKKMLG